MQPVGAVKRQRVEQYVALALAAAGVIAVWWFLWAASIDAKIWNSIPYIACLFLALAFHASLPAAVAAALMLVLDVLVAISVLLETQSPWLLALSLVVTLKFFIVLPVGLVIGWLIQKCFAPRPANGPT